MRSIELNILQRCGAHMASLTDLEESFLQGQHGVSLAAQGITGRMVTIQRTGNEPYQVSYGSSPVSEIANQVKSVPREFINAAGNDVTPEILSYLRPLIQGQPNLAFDQGIPRYLPTTHL